VEWSYFVTTFKSLNSMNAHDTMQGDLAMMPCGEPVMRSPRCPFLEGRVPVFPNKVLPPVITYGT
jgi:hypothetical protein